MKGDHYGAWCFTSPSLGTAMEESVTGKHRVRKSMYSIEARNRANKVLGFITRSVKSASAEVILKLYLALVRLHLNYAVQL